MSSEPKIQMKSMNNLKSILETGKVAMGCWLVLCSFLNFPTVSVLALYLLGFGTGNGSEGVWEDSS